MGIYNSGPCPAVLKLYSLDTNISILFFTVVESCVVIHGAVNLPLSQFRDL